MDNFPPIGGETEYLEIPYLPQRHPNLEYDGEGFLGFPERKGWSKELLLAGDFRQGHTSEETAMFLQSWIFIGFLMDVCHVPYNKSDDSLSSPCQDVAIPITPFQKMLASPDIAILRQKPGGTLIVSVFSVGDLMMRFQKQAAGGFSANDETWWLRAHDETIKKSLDGSFFIANLLKYSSMDLILDPAIQLSIQNLEDTLVWARFACWEPHLHCVTWSRPQGSRWHCPRMNELLHKKLKMGGWCSAEIAIFRSMWSTRLLYFLSMIPRKTIRDHSACSEECCKFEIIDEEIYVTQHRFPDCGCKDIDISLQVKPFFQEHGDKEDQVGHYPVIRIWSNDDDEANAKVEVMDSHDCQYVAISHVWSHGLGNPNFNSLPSCQLLQIQKYVNELWTEMDEDERLACENEKSGPKPFWIDTMCVLLSKDERKLAILRMTETYKKSKSVLALDKEIYEHDWEEDARMEELITRMASSAWYRRLWTLQEGALATSLHFRFKNRSINIGELLKSINGKKTRYGPESPDRYRFCMFLGGLAIEPDICSYRPLTKYWACKDHIGPTALWNSIQIRTTSKPEDEVICLSSLLGFDYKAKSSLFKVDVRDRMKAFLLSPSLGSIPQDILFTGWPKMHTDGLRWAPVSFTRVATGDSGLGSFFMGNGTIQARIEEDGLQVKCIGFALERSKLPLCSHFYAVLDVYSENEMWLEVADSRHWKDTSIEPWNNIGSRCSSSGTRDDTSTFPVLLLQDMPRPERSYIGVLALATREEEQTTSVRYLAIVSVTPVWGEGSQNKSNFERGVWSSENQ